MEKNYQEGIKISVITLLINLFLTIIKLVAGSVGNSQAMLADGVHTLSDVLSTIVVMVGLKVASKEADDKHPYGHERFELVFSKVLSVFLLISGVFIGVSGVQSFMSPSNIPPKRIALISAIISVLVKEIMFRYTIKTAHKIDSVSMEADAWHHRSDALSSIGTFIGILGARLGYPKMDSLAAIIVSVMVIKVGIELYLKSIGGLVDQAASSKKEAEITEYALSVAGVRDINQLKTRLFANQIYVDIDILVDGCIRVYEGHDIATEVHDLIEEKMKDVKHCNVHVEPYGSLEDCKES